MNAQLKSIPTTDTGPASALAAARAEHARVAEALNEINAQMHRTEEAAQPHQQAASAVASLRQQRAGFLARLLKGGNRVDPASSELRNIDQQIAAAAPGEQMAADVAAAKAAALAELQEQANQLHPKLVEASRALAVAQLTALGEQISGELLPALRAAAAQLAAAYGALAGSGQAHTEMARRLREQFGLSVSSLGTDRPPADIDLPVIGFGVADNGRTNVMHTDVRTAIEAGRAAALRRWSA